ncbi:hypothetical protein ACFL1J_05435, partial [Pseudomonadota bacterium]
DNGCNFCGVNLRARFKRRGSTQLINGRGHKNRELHRGTDRLMAQNNLQSDDERILLLCGQFPGEQARIDSEEMKL